MKIFKSIEEIEQIDHTVVALGNFDGIHKGHQELIRRAVQSAGSAGLKSAVFTFTNHPRNVLAGKHVVKNILYWKDKVDILEKLGVDYLFALEFDEVIRNMSPEEFIKVLLVDNFKMKEAFCGFNFNFGYKAQGNPEILMSEGKKDGFGIHVIEPVKIDGRVVSSTMIRQLIMDGRVDLCEQFMGRNYSIGGTVVVGNQIGRTIGFPTSNILIDHTMVTPPNGVYVTRCIYNGTVYQGVTNVGIKPTIGDNKKTIETHMFDFKKDIYGKWIRVEFLKKTRDEVRFPDVEELGRQIQRDCEEARTYHEENSTLQV